MKSEAEVRQALRDWVVKTSGKVTPEQVTDATPIIEQRIISSLQIMDLIMFLEQLSGKRIDVAQLKPGVFRDINTIWRNFLQP
jgi:acyl carrier protein